MKFSHKISKDKASLKGVFYEKHSGEFLEAPVLSGTLASDGETADLSWTMPEASVPIIGYHLIIDGNEQDTLISGQSTTYNVNYQTQYDFQVRAIGVTDIESSLSNTVTITGGGLPDPHVLAYGEYKGASIVWPDLASYNIDNTIEGYNVYRSTNTVSPSWTKLNDSVLPTTVLGYTSFVPQVGNEELLGFTYLYDGGQESRVYYGQIKSWANMPKYLFNTIDRVTFASTLENDLTFYYQGDYIKKGLLLKDGAKIRFFGDAVFGSVIRRQVWIREWLGIYFNDLTHVYWWFNAINHPIQRSQLHFTMDEAGDCENYTKADVWKLKSNNWSSYIDLSVKKERKDHIEAGFYFEPEHTMYGYSCASVIDMPYQLVIPEEDVIAEYGLANGKSFTFYKKTKGAQLEFDRIENGLHYFDIATYAGAPWLNFYITSKGGSYGSPFNSNPIKPNEIEQIAFDLSGLAAGDYQCKVDYLYNNKTATGLDTNQAYITL